jgi:hypothetical protein
MGCNTKALSISVPSARHGLLGILRYEAGELMQLTRADGLITTAEAAKLVNVSEATIRQWRKRGWLDRQGLNERGHPLHTKDAVRAAERQVRENGRRTSGIDPRQLRGRRATPADLQRAA